MIVIPAVFSQTLHYLVSVIVEMHTSFFTDFVIISQHYELVLSHSFITNFILMCQCHDCNIHNC